MKDDIKTIKSKTREKMVTFILAGFGLVAGLAWNDAVQSLFATLFPNAENGLIGKFLYALLITVVVVAISIYLSRLIQINEEKDN